MKQRIMASLARLEPRMLLLLMASLLAIVLLLAWWLLLRAPLADYRRLHGARAALVQTQSAPSSLQAKIGLLEGELAALTHQLQGESAPQPLDQMVVSIIDRLDRIAARRGVRLDSVHPGTTRRVLMFDEVSADIKVSGKYQALFEWLRDTEMELGPLVVTQFSMRLTDVAAGTLSMDLKLAAYRPAATGAAK
ncbi:MAG: GspMb/PilO family protein [Burkholderiales bacterium]